MDYWITVKPVTPCCFTRSVVIVTSLQRHTGGRSQFCESQFTRYAMSWKCEVCRGLKCDHQVTDLFRCSNGYLIASGCPKAQQPSAVIVPFQIVVFVGAGGKEERRDTDTFLFPSDQMSCERTACTYIFVHIRMLTIIKQKACCSAALYCLIIFFLNKTGATLTFCKGMVSYTSRFGLVSQRVCKGQHQHPSPDIFKGTCN